MKVECDKILRYMRKRRRLENHMSMGHIFQHITKASDGKYNAADS